MSNEIQQTKALAETHGLKFRDFGNGHVQLEGHGVLVNYWPLSKRRTAHVVGGDAVTRCGPWDAVKLCLGEAKPEMKPDRAPSKNGPDFSLEPITTNPAGVRNFYEGRVPPWDDRLGEFVMCQSDVLRIEAMRLRDAADAMEAEQ